MSLNTDYIIHKQDISLPIPAQSATSNPPKLGVKKFSVLGKYLGIILILLSSMTQTLSSTIVKSLPQYHAFSLNLWRLQGLLFPSLTIILFLGRNKKMREEKKVFEGVWPINYKILGVLLVRGIFGTSAGIFNFSGLKYLSVADNSVIVACNPIFVTFVAHFTLGERLGVVPILMGAFSLLGVGIISRPPLLTGEKGFDTDTLIGSGLALCCLCLITLTYVTLRYLRNIHSSISNFSLGLFGSIEVLICCGVTSTFELPQGAKDWGLVVLLAVLYFTGVMLLTLALQLEDAGPLALVRSVGVIFAYFWQYLFFNMLPDKFSVIGGFMIIFSVIIIALRKFVGELSPEDKRRRKLQFLLK